MAFQVTAEALKKEAGEFGERRAGCLRLRCADDRGAARAGLLRLAVSLCVCRRCGKYPCAQPEGQAAYVEGIAVVQWPRLRSDPCQGRNYCSISFIAVSRADLSAICLSHAVDSEGLGSVARRACHFLYLTVNYDPNGTRFSCARYVASQYAQTSRISI